jgi:hypothetical protein
VRRTAASAFSSWPNAPVTDALTPIPTMSPWPTPDASVAQDGEGVETWSARREILKAKKINGNGAGTPLSIAAQQWPTPTVPAPHDSEASAGRLRPQREGYGVDLANAAGTWRTPRAEDAEASGAHRNGTGSLYSQALWTTPTLADSKNTQAPSAEQRKGTYLFRQARLWPTPSGMAGTTESRESNGGGEFAQMVTRSEASQSSRQARPTCSHGGPCKLVLNPRFVEWLMGWPDQWSQAAPSTGGSYGSASLAMAWYLSRLRSLSLRYFGISDSEVTE